MLKYSWLLLILVPILISCSEEEPEPSPTACFTLSSTLVDLNEYVIIKNCSRNAFSYLWNDGAGNQSTLVEPVIKYPDPGNYLITLTAFSLSGNKQDVTQQTVTVIEMVGEVSFWQSGTPAYDVTTVSIGKLTDQITMNYPNGITECGANGCANFTLPTARYPFYATDGVYEWNGIVEIIANTCITMELK